MAVELLFSMAWLASAGLFALVLAFGLGLVGLKVARLGWEKYAAGREELYKAAILRAVAGEPGAPLDPVLLRGRRLGDRTILEDAILRWAAELRGFGFQRLCDIFEQGGFARLETRRLFSSRWWIRARAARRLGLMLARPAAPALVEALGDPSLDVRLQAAWALGRLGELGALDRIVASLAGDSRLAALRVTNIILELGPRAVPTLERLLAHEEARVRELAAMVLGTMGERAAAPALEGLLDSPDAGSRAAACRALAQLGAGPDSARKVLPLLDDARPDVRAEAAAALGRLGFPGSVEPLRRALGDVSWNVRFSAGESLARLAGPGRTALEAAKSDPDRFARDMAEQWLEELAAGAVR